MICVSVKLAVSRYHNVDGIKTNNRRDIRVIFCMNKQGKLLIIF